MMIFLNRSQNRVTTRVAGSVSPPMRLSCTVILGHPDASWMSGLAEELLSRNCHVVADSGTTEELLTDAVAQQPVVLVLDGRLPGPDLRAIARRAEREPGVLVLLVGPLLPHIEVLLALA